MRDAAPSPAAWQLDRRAFVTGTAALLAGCHRETDTLPRPVHRAGPTLRTRSADGTSIAYERWGSGPAVVLVDGAFCSRRFGPTEKLAPLLAGDFTVLAYDRRGRGESGDGRDLAVGREVEDLAAVIQASGGGARVVGMSSGGALALEAAASGVRMDRIAVYEVPYLDRSAPQRPPPPTWRPGSRHI